MLSWICINGSCYTLWFSSQLMQFCTNGTGQYNRLFVGYGQLWETPTSVGRLMYPVGHVSSLTTCNPIQSHFQLLYHDWCHKSASCQQSFERWHVVMRKQRHQWKGMVRHQTICCGNGLVASHYLSWSWLTCLMLPLWTNPKGRHSGDGVNVGCY